MDKEVREIKAFGIWAPKLQKPNSYAALYELNKSIKDNDREKIQRPTIPKPFKLSEARQSSKAKKEKIYFEHLDSEMRECTFNPTFESRVLEGRL
jgi:hypothetical protein